MRMGRGARKYAMLNRSVVNKPLAISNELSHAVHACFTFGDPECRTSRTIRVTKQSAGSTNTSGKVANRGPRVSGALCVTGSGDVPAGGSTKLCTSCEVTTIFSIA